MIIRSIAAAIGALLLLREPTGSLHWDQSMRSRRVYLRNKTVLRVAVSLAAVILFGAVSSAVQAETERKVYRFGVAPQFNAPQVTEIWLPIFDFIRERSGILLQLTGASSIAAFEREYRQGEFDFAYINPYFIIKPHNEQNYVPVVRDTDPIHGIIVVHKDSQFEGLKDLMGKAVAFPAPNSLGATLVIKADLAQQGIVVEPVYVRSHSSVYLNVALGQSFAGGGVQKTLDKQSPDIRNNLRVVHRTQPLSAHPIAAHPRVSKAVRDTVRDILKAMVLTENGRTMLQKIPAKAFVDAAMTDYAPLYDLNLEKFFEQE